MSEATTKQFGYLRPSIGPDKPGYVDGRWRPGMDPNYSGPCTEPTADGGGVSKSTRFDDIAPGPVSEAQRARRALAELRLRLSIMPIGYRIRALRFALGWTQATAAGQLGISTRTVIRHEQGRNVVTVRAKLFERLSRLEADHAEQLANYLDRIQPPDA